MPARHTGMDSRQVSRRTLLAGLAALAAAPLAACGSSSSQVPGLLTAKGVSWEVPQKGAPVDAISAGMAAFAHAMCRATSSGKNWVASPVSIATAFAMARVGAIGATAASLDTFFGFPAAGRDEAFNALIRAVQTVTVPPKRSDKPRDATKPPAPPIVSIGDALFPAEHLALNPAFLHTLAAQYGAGVRPVDFGSPTAVAEINAWVDVQTAGRITKVWDTLDPSTTLALVNTVYLKADWLNYFLEDPVTQDPFTRTGGSAVTVSMMHQSFMSTRYWAGPGGSAALELPFADKDGAADVSMWIILPPAGGNPVDMLDPATLARVAGSLATTDVAVSVPKWNFATELDLGTVMPAMGMKDVFGTGDFSGIARDIGTLSSAIHKANITVDEYGTEAAAVTGMAFASAAHMPPSISFVANRPFAFSVVAGASHAPLFCGVVTDPSQG